MGISQINILPFPYKMDQNSELKNGFFIQVPQFCKTNFKANKCKEFYLKIQSNPDFCQCPYGYAAKKVQIGDIEIIFSCLNLEKYSDKKLLIKRNNKKDFSPRLTIDHYILLIDQIQLIATNSKEYFNQTVQVNQLRDNLDEQKEILDNTFHELRKLNQQLKSQVESLILKANNFSSDDVEKIIYLSQNVFSTSQLISIRLNTYDFGVNPNVELFEEKSKIIIHRKFVKVAHCIREFANQKHIRINIIGESYCYIMANDVLELLPYLLLDNAIKYSRKNENIEVHFIELEDYLKVTIKGLSIRPLDKEINRLTDRGFRSERTSNIQGLGIGLYLANFICDLNNIELKINVGKNITYQDSLQYSDFTVTLIIHNIINDEEDL
jgi:signal transduction histidine kinase